MSDIIEQLRDDTKYYGKVGRQFMSNSDIKVLLDNPFHVWCPPLLTTLPLPRAASSISSSLSRRKQPRSRASTPPDATPTNTRKLVLSGA